MSFSRRCFLSSCLLLGCYFAQDVLRFKSYRCVVATFRLYISLKTFHSVLHVLGNEVPIRELVLEPERLRVIS
jgi:hypothetical protein